MVAPHTVAPQLRIKCVTKNTHDDVTILCRNQMLLHMYFRRIAMLKVLYHCVGLILITYNASENYSCLYKLCLSPNLNGSSAMQCFEHSDPIEIGDEITFGFNMG